MSHTDQIQAPTTNTTGLMATPCMLTSQDRKARVTFSADGAREHTEPAACTAYNWCTETGPHYDHASAEATITDTRGEEVIDAHLLFNSGSSPIIGISGSDFTPDQARVKAAELRRLADTVDALAAKAQFAANPNRTWTYTRQGDRAIVSVTCPSWCESDHRTDQYLTTAPEDIHHEAYGREVTVKANETGTYEDRRILSAKLTVAPDSDEAQCRAPHVQAEIVDDVWSRPMGPDELGAFIGAVAGQLDELRALHTRLVAIRAENTAAAA
ncbi:hypothetical protein RB628_03570 [Streptomyces sp. ADMS]|uniref:DUF6907 domain-containing protein n=1 Tax=Streptomyces sp. ADMS TaxID=3071415 RepID=UPI00296F3E05|nr:hypothetical protein [Streptomyces sp. ADMS]MDW4904439.1 hypothetical protein [Streptomyces sp. ADMS]